MSSELCGCSCADRGLSAHAATCFEWTGAKLTGRRRVSVGQLTFVAWIWYGWLPGGRFYGSVTLGHFVPALVTIVIFAARGLFDEILLVGLIPNVVDPSLLSDGLRKCTDATNTAASDDTR